MHDIRSQFPFFDNNPHITYLDSAATSQKPQFVIDKVSQYLTKVSNPGRSGYGMSLQVDCLIEKVRIKVASFCGVKSQDIAFTKGSTESMNLITRSFAKYVLEDGDEILVCSNDHKASILPWFYIIDILKISNINVKMVFYKTDPFSGQIDQSDLFEKITCKTKFVVLTHSNSVFGVINPIEDIILKLPADVFSIVDCAQSVGHVQIDFDKISADFGFFSGHKMFSLGGIGILYASDRVKNRIKQCEFGGGVNTSKFPNILEVGTKNTVSIISLGAAIDFVREVGIEIIEQKITCLTLELLERLQKIQSIEFLAGIAYNKNNTTTGIISFVIDCDMDYLANWLDQSRVNLRIGSHCAQDSKDSIRVSLHAYNNSDDIEILVTVIERFLKNLT